MSPPRLPAEMRDYIVEYLLDDLEALKACSLASKEFLHISRTCLFRSFSVPDPAAFEEFRQRLETHSVIPERLHFSYYIRDITINMIGSSEDMHGALTSSRINRNVINTLACLPRLKRLKISGMRISETTLTPHMKLLFNYILADLDMLHLHSISFATMDDLRQLLSACHRLTQLRISKINWPWAGILYPNLVSALTYDPSDEDEDGPAAISTPMRMPPVAEAPIFPFLLTELSISDVLAPVARGILDGLLARSWKLLRSLTLHIEGGVDQSLAMFSRVLDEVGPVLEDLTLSVHGFTPGHAGESRKRTIQNEFFWNSNASERFIDKFTLAACTQLRTLCLEDPAEDKISVSPSKYDWMAFILDTLPSDSSPLRRIKIRMTMYQENMAYHVLSFTSWTRLDHIFNRLREHHEYLHVGIQLLYTQRKGNKRWRLRMCGTGGVSSPKRAADIVKQFMSKSLDILDVIYEKY